MNIDKKELTQIGAAGKARYDMYRKIHKAMRMAMTDILVRVGQLDSNDPICVKDTCARFQAFAEFCEHHLAMENAYVHPALEAKEPGSSGRVGEEHVQHERDIASLQQLAQQLESALPEERARIAHTLYHDLTLFIADNLVHMFVEETANNGVLWKHFSDAEIQALDQRLQAAIAPEFVPGVLRWMIPAISHTERLEMFSSMKQRAPSEVLEANVRLAREVLAWPEWQKLLVGLGVPVDVWATLY